MLVSTARLDGKCGKPATRAFLLVNASVRTVQPRSRRSVLPGTVIVVCEEHAKIHAQGDGMFQEMTLDEAMVYRVQTE